MALDDDLSRLVEMVGGRPLAVLVGAGLSTDSGIPDYRSPGRLSRVPMQHREFVQKASARRRYWARSYVGWPRMSAARPNAGHAALSTLEKSGAVCGLISQNVDGLHGLAGSRRVVELHGALARVRCLDCGTVEAREALQGRLRGLNRHWESAGALLPDGDAELAVIAEETFVVAACVSCGGVLKPDVVFFGDNVRPSTLAEAWQIFAQGEALLVVGSSLTVWSGYRFVKRAAEEGRPVVIANLGPTRGDALATLKLDAPLGLVLPQLAAVLPRPAAALSATEDQG